MAEKENNSCLTDSSGSDGSLSKDLSRRAELNFSTPSVALEDEQIGKSGDTVVEKNQAKEVNSVEEGEKMIAADLNMENTATIDEMTDSEVDALMVCEKCHGPIIKMKRYGNSGKQFCSKQCAQSQLRMQPLNGKDDNCYDVKNNTRDDNVSKSAGDMVIDQHEAFSDANTNSQDRDEIGSKADAGTDKPAGIEFNWKDYQKELLKKSASSACFGKLPRPVKGLKPGMKLEALDKNNPCNYCVATVIDVVGYRVRIRYDGFGDNDSQDFWCNFQAEELYPIGWCAENSFPLQPPHGISSTLEHWKIFLTETLTGALAAPMDLFRESENRTQAKVHSFQAGLKVEVIHPKKPSIICPATISKSLGPYLYQVTTEPLPNLPSHTFYGRTESTGIFSFGWSERNFIDLALPSYVDTSGLSKEKYLAMCRKKSAPPTHNESKRIKNPFKIGTKIAAVDFEEPHVIRVATIYHMVGKVLHLLFDDQEKFQYVDSESEDIFPIEWFFNTGHPLCTPHGTVCTAKGEQLTEAELSIDECGNRYVKLPSFQNVLGKQLPHAKEELNKKLKAKAENSSMSTPTENTCQSSRESQEKTQEVAEQDQQEVYSVYFNKSCIMGPLLDPEKVAKMPESTAPTRPPAALRLALERLIAVAIDPFQTMDALQEGVCAKLFSRGKSKVLKKGLCRFDTKVRASRLLKRLCKKLKSCDYFLSFDPTKDPCPLDCQTSGTTTLDGFITMRNLKAKEMIGEDYRKKRGRPRKDDFETEADINNSKGDFARGNDHRLVQRSTPKTQVRLLNLSSYNGRPLVPIAPGSKTPITIMPATSQVHHGRPPPPYEMGGPTSFVHQVHSNTVITSATQPRMVTPVSVRMLQPSVQSPGISGKDLASPTLTTPQNLATVLVVTKAPVGSQQSQGILSLRGNVANQGIRLPVTTNTRKGQIQVISGGARSKIPGAIKIHGPMFDQAPGTMNPMAPGAELKQLMPSSPRTENHLKLLQMAQPVHIPSQNKSNQKQIFDGGENIVPEFPLYRGVGNSQLVDQTQNQSQRFTSMKQPIDMKAEPQDPHLFQQTNSSPVQQMSPTIHIHHPSSSNFHHISQDNLQDSLKHHDGVIMHMADDDMEKSSRSTSSASSPIKNNIAVKYDLVSSQHGMNRHLHNQQLQPHASSLPGHMKNHLKVATTNADGSQSALSPLHSPPPLRPAPSGQQRSIALGSPPKLTPSTVISHFDFTPVTTTTSIISQSGRIIHHPGTPISSKAFQDGGNSLSNGQGVAHEAAVNSGGLLSPSTPSSNVTVTLTYIPVKTQPSDKIVYVPVSHNFMKDKQQQQQQPIFIYSKPGKDYHFKEQLPGGGHQVLKPRHHDMKVPISSLDEIGQQPYSGVTRKFTVRTLQRDSNNAPISSGLTTVRIQGSKLNEIGTSASQNFQDVMYYSPKDIASDNLATSSPVLMNTNRGVIPMRRTIGSIVGSHGNEDINQSESRLNNEVSFYNSNDTNYEEISDDEEDDDLGNDGSCYDKFSFDNTTNETSPSVHNKSTLRHGLGGQIRKQERKQFLSKRKGVATHNFKLKYKQALEQAKFMRERRPSFAAHQTYDGLSEHSQLASVADSSSFDSQAKVVENAVYDCESPAGCPPTREDDESIGKISAIKENKLKQEHLVDDDSVKNSYINGTHYMIKERQSPANESSKSGIEERGKNEVNSLKRKMTDNSLLLEQWSICNDAQIKRRKKLSSSSGNQTKYLSDPMEKVKLPRNPESWSEEDVANFINATECSEYADTLKDQEIDGSALLLLTRESLMEFTGMKLGPALKICGYVATLKGRLRMQQNIALIQG